VDQLFAATAEGYPPAGSSPLALLQETQQEQGLFLVGDEIRGRVETGLAFVDAEQAVIVAVAQLRAGR
jgi:hypothetical protein